MTLREELEGSNPDRDQRVLIFGSPGSADCSNGTIATIPGRGGHATAALIGLGDAYWPVLSVRWMYPEFILGFSTEASDPKSALTVQTVALRLVIVVGDR